MSETEHADARPHLLYVAWVFPPSTGGGVYRTLATANAMAEVGFRVTVLAADPDAFRRFTGSDESLLDRIDPRVEVVRVPFDWPVRDMDVSRWPRARAVRPKAWLVEYHSHDKDTFPEANFGPWHDRLIAAADRVHAADPVDVVVGTANPNVDFAVGHHLFTTAGVPYVMDHRDAWRLDVYGGGELHTDDPRVAETETAYVRDAHEVWFVNEPIRAWHAELYPNAADRMRIVENGFDPGMAPDAKLDPPKDGEPLVFSYLGTIGPKVPIAEMIEGWIIARRESADLRAATADIWGHLTASGSSPTPGLLARAEPHGIGYRGPVPKAKVAGVYQGSDVLLLILAAGRYVTSGKVYEYMASGLPIVSIHEPGNAAADILQDYPLWIQAEDLSVDGVSDALIRGAELARSATLEQRRACVDFAARYERSLQLLGPLTELRAFVESRGVSA